MLGAYDVANVTDGVKFKVGSGLTDKHRNNPLEIGTIITYKYFEIIKDSGVPRFPTFLRVKKRV